MEAGAIRELPRADARRLCSMQVHPTIPAIVKELIENSLDAGATSVEVGLVGAGLDQIKVKDNGHGVLADSVPLMARPGCTSKIRAYSDLHADGFNSLGFRGEALASLCQLAGGLQILTMTDASECGHKYNLNTHGEVESSSVTALSAPGTEVVATGCFANVPVRKRKFQREKKQVVAEVKELVLIYCLARPDVRFQLRAKDPSETLVKPGAMLLGDAIRTVFRPRNILDSLGYAKAKDTSADTNIAVEGFFPTSCKATVSRPSRYYIFVNRRPAIVKPIRQYIRDWVTTALPDSASQHPWVVVHFTVPGGMIDVNMSKDKSELLLLADAEDVIKRVLGDLLTKLIPQNRPAAHEPSIKTGQTMAVVETTDSAPTSITPSADVVSSQPVVNLESVSGVPTVADSVCTMTHGSQSMDEREIHHAYETSGEQSAVADTVTSLTGFEQRREAEVASLSPSGGSQKWSLPWNVSLNKRSSPTVVSSNKQKRRKLATTPTAPGAFDLVSWSRSASEMPPSLQLSQSNTADEEIVHEKDGKSIVSEKPQICDVDDTDDDFAVDEPGEHQVHPTPLTSFKHSVDVMDITRGAQVYLARPSKCMEPLNTLRIVGSCSGEGVEGRAWVVTDGTAVMLINVYRAREAMAFAALSEEYTVPSVQLSASQAVDNAHAVLASQIEQYLQTEPDASGVKLKVTDPSIVKNGFTVSLLRQQSNTWEINVSSTPRCGAVPGWGALNLLPLLEEAIVERRSGSTKVYRPSPVRIHLESESVRVSRSFSIDNDTERIFELLPAIMNGGNCVHGRPVAQRFDLSPPTDE